MESSDPTFKFLLASMHLKELVLLIKSVVLISIKIHLKSHQTGFIFFIYPKTSTFFERFEPNTKSRDIGMISFLGLVGAIFMNSCICPTMINLFSIFHTTSMMFFTPCQVKHRN